MHRAMISAWLNAFRTSTSELYKYNKGLKEKKKKKKNDFALNSIVVAGFWGNINVLDECVFLSACSWTIMLL